MGRSGRRAHRSVFMVRRIAESALQCSSRRLCSALILARSPQGEASKDGGGHRRRCLRFCIGALWNAGGRSFHARPRGSRRPLGPPHNEGSLWRLRLLFYSQCNCPLHPRRRLGPNGRPPTAHPPATRSGSRDYHLSGWRCHRPSSRRVRAPRYRRASPRRRSRTPPPPRPCHPAGSVGRS